LLSVLGTRRCSCPTARILRCIPRLLSRMPPRARRRLRRLLPVLFVPPYLLDWRVGPADLRRSSKGKRRPSGSGLGPFVSDVSKSVSRCAAKARPETRFACDRDVPQQALAFRPQLPARTPWPFLRLAGLDSCASTRRLVRFKHRVRELTGRHRGSQQQGSAGTGGQAKRRNLKLLICDRGHTQSIMVLQERSRSAGGNL